MVRVDGISIHVPAWGTTVKQLEERIAQRFQSTFPRGERRQECHRKLHADDFNPRSRVGNDGGRMLKSYDEMKFQSTFPRGERQCKVAASFFSGISIHVPAWGTT